MKSREELEELVDEDELKDSVKRLEALLPNLSSDLEIEGGRYAMVLFAKSAVTIYQKLTRMQKINAKLQEEENDTKSN